MVVLTMAVPLPTVQAAGIDLIWFGIFVVLVVEKGSAHRAALLRPAGEPIPRRPLERALMRLLEI